MLFVATVLLAQQISSFHKTWKVEEACGKLCALMFLQQKSVVPYMLWISVNPASLSKL